MTWKSHQIFAKNDSLWLVCEAAICFALFLSHVFCHRYFKSEIDGEHCIECIQCAFRIQKKHKLNEEFRHTWSAYGEFELTSFGIMMQTNHGKYVFGFQMVHEELSWVLHFERFLNTKSKSFTHTHTHALSF